MADLRAELDRYRDGGGRGGFGGRLDYRPNDGSRDPLLDRLAGYGPDDRYGDDVSPGARRPYGEYLRGGSSPRSAGPKKLRFTLNARDLKPPSDRGRSSSGGGSGGRKSSTSAAAKPSMGLAAKDKKASVYGDSRDDKAAGGADTYYVLHARDAGGLLERLGKSKTVVHSAHPSWDVLEVEAHKLEDFDARKLRIEVYDEERISPTSSRDELIGVAEIDLPYNLMELLGRGMEHQLQARSLKPDDGKGGGSATKLGGSGTGTRGTVEGHVVMIGGDVHRDDDDRDRGRYDYYDSRRGRGWSEADVRAAFDKFDTNRSGKMDYRELREALRHLGLDTEARDAEEVLRRYDSNNNGLLDPPEFGRLVRQLTGDRRDYDGRRDGRDRDRSRDRDRDRGGSGRVPKPVKDAFDRYDANRSGKLDYKELKNALRATGLDVRDDTDAATLLRRYDQDRSGLMDLDEFAELVDALHREMVRVLEREKSNLQDELLRGGGHRGLHYDAAPRSPRGAPARPSSRAVPSDIADTFERYDANRSGQLDYKELRNALQAMGLDVSEQKAAQLLQDYDRDGNGLMDIGEFADLVSSVRGVNLHSLKSRYQKSEKTLQAEAAIGAALGARDIRAAFDRFDANKSGKLDYKELRGALKTVGLEPSEQQAAALLGKYDKDGTGLLEVHEFAELVSAFRRVRLEGLAAENTALRAEAGKQQPVAPEVRAAFERHDASRSGKLDVRALREALQVVGLDLSAHSAAQLLQRFDRDKSGMIELGEFAALTAALRAAQLEQVTKELAQAKTQLSTAVRVADDVRAAFDRFDLNKNGRLDYHELRNALQAYGLDHEAKHAQSLLAEFDKDKSGSMELSEFDALIGALRKIDGREAGSLRAALKKNEEELKAVRAELARLQKVGVPADVRAVFERFDANRSGKLDVRELRRALEAAGLQPSAKEAERILVKFDADGNGLLDLSEFSQLVSEMRGAHIQGTRGSEEALRAGLGTKDEEIARMRAALSQKDGEIVALRRELTRAQQVPEDVRVAFDRYDRSRRGQLDYRDLRSALHAARVDTETSEAASLFAQFEQRAGAIELAEFARLVEGFRRQHTDAVSAELKALRAEVSRLRKDRLAGADGDVRAIFSKFDRNRSGHLDVRELRAALHALSLDASSREAAALLQRYDLDRNGLMELDEFAELVAALRRASHESSGLDVEKLKRALRKQEDEIAALRDRLQRGAVARTSDEVRQAFDRLDVNHTGRIDYRELRSALKGAGIDASSRGAESLLAKYDRSRSGHMELGEFSQLCEAVRGVQLATASAELASLQSEVAAKDREIAALRKELEAARGALGQARPVAAEVRTVFERFDANRSGRLDFRELRAALAAAGLDASSAGAAQLIDQYDRDGSGLMELAEFSDLVVALRRQQMEGMASELGALRAQLGKPPDRDREPRPALRAEGQRRYT